MKGGRESHRSSIHKSSFQSLCHSSAWTLFDVMYTTRVHTGPTSLSASIASSDPRGKQEGAVFTLHPYRSVRSWWWTQTEAGEENLRSALSLAAILTCDGVKIRMIVILCSAESWILKPCSLSRSDLRPRNNEAAACVLRGGRR